jgi:hypothetical protein
MQKSVYFNPDIQGKIQGEADKLEISFSKRLMQIIKQYFESKPKDK